MKYLLLLLFLILPTVVVCANEPIKSDKIKMDFLGWSDNTVKETKLRNWIVDYTSNGMPGELARRRIKIIFNFNTINSIKITDVNVDKRNCNQRKQSWKKKDLLLIFFKDITVPELTLSVPIPCILVHSKYKRYIELKVIVRTNKGLYYNTFILHDD